MSQILTTAEVSELLRLHKITVCKMAKLGKLPSIRIGRVFRFDKELIEKWMKSGGSK